MSDPVRVFVDYLSRHFPEGAAIEAEALAKVDADLRQKLTDLHAANPSHGFDQYLARWIALLARYDGDPAGLRRFVDGGGVDPERPEPIGVERGADPAPPSEPAPKPSRFRWRDPAPAVERSPGDGPNEAAPSVDAPDPRPADADTATSDAAVETAGPAVAATGGGRLLPLLALGAALLALGYSWSSKTCGLPFSGCAESGWIEADNATARTLSFAHGLGVAPSEVTILFKAEAAATDAIVVGFDWGSNHSGNPVVVEATPEAINLQIFNGAPIRGTWSAAKGWTLYTKGVFKIRARR